MFRPMIAVCVLALAARAQEGGAYAVVNAPGGVVKASLFSDQYASLPVAQVDGKPVTLREFREALGEVHSTRAATDKAGAKNFSPVLDRLIAGRLIALEAHEMGIDEMPEVKKAVADYSEMTLRAVLEEQVTKGITADRNEVELYVREAVREWKLRSVLFAKEADAREASAALKAGKKWEEATKKGEPSDSPEYVRRDKMLPQVAAAAEGLFAGQVSDPVKVDAGWAIFQVEDLRYPEDAGERAKAEARSLDERREKALKSWYAALVKRTVTTNRALLNKLDFEAKKPGFAALEKDKRVLSRVRGGTAITVGALGVALRASFFHGVEDAIKVHEVNKAKVPVFEKELAREVMLAEAKRRHVEATDQYRRRVSAYRESMIFGTFVQKAILPGLKITEDEGKAYYQKHKGEFTFPAFYKLQSLAFGTSRQAQAAYDKLKAGTDFTWLKQNADGQLPEDKRALDFTGGTVSANALSVALAAKLKDTRAGEYRLYAAEGQYFLLRVLAVTPQKEQPYLQVRAEIAKRLSGEKVTTAVNEWVGKLRKAHDVKIYLAQIGS